MHPPPRHRANAVELAHDAGDPRAVYVAEGDSDAQASSNFANGAKRRLKPATPVPGFVPVSLGQVECNGGHRPPKLILAIPVAALDDAEGWPEGFDGLDGEFQ